MKLDRFNKYVINCSLIALLTTGAPAFASETTSDASAVDAAAGEIVVVARKREERLLNVPISVQAFSGENLKNSGTYDLHDLKVSAGFSFTQNNGTTAAGRSYGALACRGLISTYGSVYENSCSLFVDGIYVSSAQSSVNTVDVERVEVLKGPQNTYFGRNTFGGAINFVTRNPSDKFRGEANATVTARGSSDVDLTVEGPIVPGKLNGRVTVVSHIKAPMFTALDGGELGREKTTSITGTLYSTPSDSLWLRFRGTYQQDNDGAAPFAFLRGNSSYGNTCEGKTINARDRNGKPTTAYIRTPYFCGSVPSIKQVGEGIVSANTALTPAFRNAIVNNTFSNSDPLLRSDSFLAGAPTLDHMGLRRNLVRLSAQAGLDLPGGGDIALNLGYSDTDQVSIFDADRSSVATITAANVTLAQDFTGDLRISTNQSKRVRGMIGISYFWAKYQMAQIDDNVITNGTPGISSTFYNDDRTSVPAFYASVDYDLTDSVTLIAETRYQADTIKAYERPRTGRDRKMYSSTFKSWLPRFIVKFQPTEATNLYASYSIGVLPAALNSGYINANAAQKAELERRYPGVSEFSPLPTLHNYELGWKQRLFDGKLQFSLAGFRMKWIDQSVISANFNEDGQNIFPSGGLSVRSTNDATIYGLEFAADARLAKGWDAGFSVNYLHATWDKYENSALGTLVAISGTTAADSARVRLPRFDGNKFGRVPTWTGAFNTSYKGELAGDWDWTVRADVSYTGGIWESDANIVKSDDFFRVNASIGVERDSMKIELFAKNLFNDQTWDYAYRSTDLAFLPLTSYSYQGLAVIPANKREIGIRTRFKF